MTKRDKYIFFALVFTGLLCYGGLWLSYYLQLLRSIDEGRTIQCNENTQDQFTGYVTDIKRFESNDFMNGKYFSVYITTDDSLKRTIHYQYILPENQALNGLVVIGQFVQKTKGESVFKLFESQEKAQEFYVAKCDLVER